MRTKGSLGPDLDHETRKTRIRTWHVQSKNLTIFYDEK
jgi:hypothetical protein